MRLQKQLFGRYVKLEIIGDTKTEVVQWRDYFWNWAAIKITNIAFDCSVHLDNQEKEIDELADGFHFSFFATKEGIIKAYCSSMAVKVNWEKVTQKFGKKGRKELHERIARAARRRFDRIPTESRSNPDEPPDDLEVVEEEEVVLT